MTMESGKFIVERWLLPVIDHWGTQYVVGLKLGHFRQLLCPFEVIEFESDRGRGRGPAIPVRRDKALVFSGCDSRAATGRSSR